MGARLLERLRVPSAFIAANWAGLLGLLVLGWVPAFAGTQRVMAHVREHADEAGAMVLTQLRRTWRRDLPVSLAALAMLAAGAASIAVLVRVFDAPTRVFFVGILVPVYLVAAALLSAYVRAAATLPLAATRGEVVDETLALVLGSPARAVLSVLAALVSAPFLVLAPLTVACGLSVPAWVVGQAWGRGGRRAVPAA